jgi:hypothetical protein
MSQHAFQRQQPGLTSHHAEITQRQVWALASGYVLYFVLCVAVLIFYNRYMEDRHRRGLGGQPQLLQ